MVLGHREAEGVVEAREVERPGSLDRIQLSRDVMTAVESDPAFDRLHKPELQKRPPGEPPDLKKVVADTTDGMNS